MCEDAELCAGPEGRAWAALPADRPDVIEVNSGPGKAEFVVDASARGA